MRIANTILAVALAATALPAMAAFPNANLGVPVTCENYAFEEPVIAAGDTFGDFPQVEAGDTFTFTLTNIDAASAQWRVVSNASGDPDSTLVGGGVLGGTLTYTVTAAAMEFPIGVYIDAIEGGTATITASCVNIPDGGPAPAQTIATVPAVSLWSLLALTLAATLGAGFVLRSRS
mgnify:CR=1 FL=1